MAKLEVDTELEVLAWLEDPEPAVFQGQDLTGVSLVMASLPLSGCSFFGCRMGPELAEAAARAGCLIFPKVPGMPFDAFRPALYSPDELYDRFDPVRPAASYLECLDWRVYDSLRNPETRALRAVDLDVQLARRIHDASISDALEDILDLDTRLRAVAVMGGHDVARDAPVYAAIAELAQTLCGRGFLVLTGGGPGPHGGLQPWRLLCRLLRSARCP